MNNKSVGKLHIWQLLLLILFPILTAVVCLSIGRMNVPVKDVFAILWNGMLGKQENTTAAAAILSARLPRVLTALAVGAGLSAAGAAFQSLFANPLATPDTVGVASGSSFGAALGILLGLGSIGTQGFSFLAGIGAVVLTWALGSGKNRKLSSVVLAGIMVGSLFSALVSLVKFTADSENELPAITYFLMGTFGSSSFKKLAVGIFPILAGLVTLFLLRWRMNLLPYSEDEVRSFGVNLKKLRIVTLIAATLMTSASVAMCGQVGWIGLITPHMCRMAFGNNHRSLIPASALTGAGFMVIVDTLARSLTKTEIPVSVLTAVIGAPFFLYLMRKKGGWSL